VIGSVGIPLAGMASEIIASVSLKSEVSVDCLKKIGWAVARRGVLYGFPTEIDGVRGGCGPGEHFLAAGVDARSAEGQLRPRAAAVAAADGSHHRGLPSARPLGVRKNPPPSCASTGGGA